MSRSAKVRSKAPPQEGDSGVLTRGKRTSAAELRIAQQANDEALGRQQSSWLNDETLTLTERAYRTIEDMICTLKLPPGSSVSEKTLSAQLGIGRTPVREALQRLSRDGLVVVLQRRGVLVSEIDVQTQLRILEVRRALETLMARLAAERANDQHIFQLAQVAAAIRTTADTHDDITFVRLDAQLNELLGKACGNRFAENSMGLTNALQRRFWYRYYKEVGDMPLTARLHAEVAEAVVRRDPDEAEAAMHRLLDSIEEFSRRALER